MKRIDVGQLLHILANVGAIGGLVFLGIQLRQNSALLRAEARATRAQIRIDDYANRINNSELVAAAMKQRRGEPLSDTEVFLLETDLRMSLTRWQFIYGEYRQGLIEDVDVPIEDWRRVFSRRPEFATVWQRTSRESFRPDFVKWMNENVVSRPPPAEAPDADVTTSIETPH